MSTRAEDLAMALVDEGMTLYEICRRFYISETGARQRITTMRRKVLPGLAAICPRPTGDNGWVYRVLDRDGMRDNPELVEAGADVMEHDNKRRLMTMLETAEPYVDALDGRSKVRKARAQVYVNAARSALSALELIDISSNGEL
jgi:hypothetical protein